jgi:hypothetical protein
MKRIGLLIIVLTLILAALGLGYDDIDDGKEYFEPGLEHFVKTGAYSPGQFSDVSPTDWFAGNVAAAYELGLMQGSGEGRFNASGNVKIAEAIALAARIDSIFFTGRADFEQGAVWHQCYVDYALDVGIIDSPFDDYDVEATRAQFAQILCGALPTYALEQINWIDDGAIPDVPATESFAEAVYRLYRAGILTGSDELGSFKPDTGISRVEAAAIVTRMADESLRRTVTLYSEY